MAYREVTMIEAKEIPFVVGRSSQAADRSHA
jgi:hypothetical protein